VTNAANNAFRSATEWGSAIRQGEISCLELLDLYIARIEEYNTAVNAVVCLDIEKAREAAVAADHRIARGEPLGPLHGIPMTVKEAFDIVGMPSTWGVPALAESYPARNAHVVDRLVGAGAIILGKTNVPAWLSDWQTFNAVYGTTSNPWDLSRVPGGSSGGSAAAVAAGFAACEYGSDIAGSIRGPAHFCGVYGHKPTCDVVSGRGHAPPGVTLDPDIAAVGPMARSALDLRLLLLATAGPAPSRDSAWQLSLPACNKSSLADFTVAIITDDSDFPVDSEVKTVLENLYRQIEEAGARVRYDIAPTFESRELMEIFGQMRNAATSDGQDDASYKHNLAMLSKVDGAGEGYRGRSLRGLTMAHYRWLQLNERREQLRLEWDRVFADVDLLLCPPATTVAFPHDQKGERYERMVEVNGRSVPGTDETFWAGISGFFHLPATVAPAGLGASGMPVGVQIVGQRYQDLQCIRFAELMEEHIVGFTAPNDYT